MARKTPKDFPKSLHSHFLTEYKHNYYTAKRLWLGQSIAKDKKDRSEGILILLKGNVKVLTDRGIPEANARRLVDSIELMALRQGNLFSSFLFNDYLAEERSESFGEFLDTHWERLHNAMTAKTFPFHSETEAVFLAHEYCNFVLTYKAQGHRLAKAAVEALTQAEVRLFIGGSLGLVIAKPSVAASIIKSILDKVNGVSFKNPTVDQVRNVFYKAYAKAIMATDETAALSFYQIGGAASQVCYSCYKAMYEDPLSERIGEISSVDAMAYARFLYDNAEEMGPQKLIVLIQLLNEPTLFGIGHKRPLRDVLMRMAKEDNAVELLLTLADLALSYRKTLPTAKEWAKALDDGIDAFGSGELLAELVTDTSKGEARDRKAQRKLRSLIGLY